MTSPELVTAFIPGAAGRLHVSLRRAATGSRCVLFVPPFAEEMNKTRRQAALTAQMLARHNVSALVFDLYGTGDSDGEFSDATWDIWLSDVGSVYRWADDQGLVIDSMVATRLGCLLAAAALNKHGRAVKRSVFWQPVNSGQRHVSSFLRVAVAATLMRNGPAVSVELLRQKLSAGEQLEIAGYRLSPALASAIDAQSLVQLAGKRLGRTHMLFVSRSRRSGETVEDTRIDDLAESLGVRAHVLRLPGVPYWASSEVVVNDGLIDVTRQILIN